MSRCILRVVFAQVLICCVASCWGTQCSDSSTTTTIVQTLTTTRFTTTTASTSSIERDVSSTTVIEEIIVSTTDVVVTETDHLSASTSTIPPPEVTVTVTEKGTTSTHSTTQTRTTRTTKTTKTTTSSPSAVSSTTSGSASYSGADFRHAVLNSTNYYRSRHLAQDLTWNDTLASFAQTWAEKCLWEDSDGPYGENLAEGFATSPLAVDAWGNEGQHYDYGRPGFSESTGHFTQLVWQATTAVGCGAANCSNGAADGANGWYLVCDYWPAGNVAGEYAENVKVKGMSKIGNPGLLFSAASSGYGASAMAGCLVVLNMAFASWKWSG